MTQKTYFNGAWLGCDTESGLGFPEWQSLFESFAIPCRQMSTEGFTSPDLQAFIQSHGLFAVLVPIDPAQTFLPKISSFITPSGGMQSNPLHRIGPPLSEDLYQQVAPYLPNPGPYS